MGTSVGSRIGLAVLLAVLVAGATTLSGASKITFYSDIGCGGDTFSIVNCGYCQNLILFGGFKFVYSHGQPLTFYSRYDCSMNAGTLTKSDGACGGLKFYRSVKLFCSPSEAAAAAVSSA